MAYNEFDADEWAQVFNKPSDEPKEEKVVEYRPYLPEYNLSDLKAKWIKESDGKEFEKLAAYTIIYSYYNGLDLNRKEVAHGQIMNVSDGCDFKVDDVVDYSGEYEAYTILGENFVIITNLNKMKIVHKQVEHVVHDPIVEKVVENFDTTECGDVVVTHVENDSDLIQYINACYKLMMINPELFKIKFNVMAADLKFHDKLQQKIPDKAFIAYIHSMLRAYDKIYKDQKYKKQHNKKQFGDKYKEPHIFAEDVVSDKYKVPIDKLRKFIASRNGFKQAMVN